MIGLLVLLAIVVGVAFWVMGMYNGLVTARNAFKNAFAQIDVQLQRRFDLIPNLVETVKGYATHEKGTLEAVTNARAAAASARGVDEKVQAENMLTGALRQLFAVAEAYPELRANENFQQLQAEITGTEGQIATARQIFNDTVLNYNNAIQTFPGVIIAGPFGFSAREFLEMEEAARAVPQVDFKDMPGREQPPAT